MVAHTQGTGSSTVVGSNVDLDDVALRVVERPGAGRTLLLVHGWGSDHRVWDRVVIASPGDRLIMPDLRGHGSSSRATTPHTVAAMADDLDQLAHRRDLDDIIVVGHSMGGNVAVELGVRAPSWLRAVVVVDPAYDDPGWADAPARTADLCEQGSQAAAGQLHRAFSTGADPEVRAQVRDTLLATDPEVLVESLRSTYLDPSAFGHRADTQRVLARLRLPLLALYSTPEAAASARALPVVDQHVELVAGSGHFVPLEQPDALQTALNRWLADQTPP